MVKETLEIISVEKSYGIACVAISHFSLARIENFLTNLLYIYTFLKFFLCLCVHKVKLANIVEGDPKAPFSIATTPRCWGGRYSFPWIALLYP